jgi:uncharacterized protein (TIGR02466 family)
MESDEPLHYFELPPVDGVKHVFSTPIWIFTFPHAESVNPILNTAILDASKTYHSLGKSNIGGWRSRNDFFHWAIPEVQTIGSWIMECVRHIVEATSRPNPFRGTLSAVGWASVCRAGNYNAPHVHPQSAWSGVYYVDPGTASADHPLSGQLEFLDPRGRTEMAATPGDPFGDPIRVVPKAGLMVIFPSWLYHWVHPYASEGTRVAVSFNVAVSAEG